MGWMDGFKIMCVCVCVGVYVCSGSDFPTTSSSPPPQPHYTRNYDTKQTNKPPPSTLLPIIYPHPTLLPNIPTPPPFFLYPTPPHPSKPKPTPFFLLLLPKKFQNIYIYNQGINEKESKKTRKDEERKGWGGGKERSVIKYLPQCMFVLYIYICTCSIHPYIIHTMDYTNPTNKTPPWCSAHRRFRTILYFRSNSLYITCHRESQPPLQTAAGPCKPSIQRWWVYVG